MARVLLCWELGAGLGHLASLQPLAVRLAGGPHRIYAALRDLSRAEQVFAGCRATFLQAPHRNRRSATEIHPILNFAHILHNIGFGDLEELRALTQAWRCLFEYVQPDLIVFDHSPTALLAARGLKARRVLIGTGFCCPVDQYPMPPLRPALVRDQSVLRSAEDRLLGQTNRLLAECGQPPLDRIGQLYSEVDETILTTFAEIDHYTGRPNGHYWGPYPQVTGQVPDWPEGRGKRVFAYLKPFPAIAKLFESLRRLGCPTLVYLDGGHPGLPKRFEAETLRFTSRPLDLGEVGRTCDLAILNAGHGSTLSMLLAGKPVLLAPIYLEQCMTTRSVVQLGAGLGAAPDRPDQIAQQLETLLASGRFTEAAQRFARRYRDWNSATRMDQMAARVEEVLEGATGSPERTCVQRVPSLQEPDWSLPAPSA